MHILHLPTCMLHQSMCGSVQQNNKPYQAVRKCCVQASNRLVGCEKAKDQVQDLVLRWKIFLGANPMTVWYQSTVLVVEETPQWQVELPLKP